MTLSGKKNERENRREMRERRRRWEGRERRRERERSMSRNGVKLFQPSSLSLRAASSSLRREGGRKLNSQVSGRSLSLVPPPRAAP